MNKRIRAFTILEVTVAMLLAAIVIVIMYTAYSIVVRSYGTYNMKNTNMAVVLRVDALLRRDFESAEMINKTVTGLTCVNQGKIVIYEFKTGEVVRTSGITDTFKVNVQAVRLFFENKPITEAELEGEQGRIDELQLEILCEERNIANTYFKHYSSENLIQRSNNAIHRSE